MNSIDKQSSCKNCGQHLLGSHCWQCGQKNIARLHTREIVDNVLDGTFNLKKGYFFTFKELLIRPWSVIHDYIEGKRRNLYNPVKYLIISLALVSFALLIPSSKEHYISISTEIHKGQTAQNLNQFGDYLDRYFNLMMFAVIPLISFFTKLLFRKKKYNYAEHFVANSYSFAQINLFSFVFSMLILVIPASLITSVDYISFLLPLIYLVWFYIKTFEENWKAGIAKSLLIFIINILLLLMLTVIVLLFHRFNNS